MFVLLWAREEMRKESVKKRGLKCVTERQGKNENELQNKTAQCTKKERERERETECVIYR